METKKKIQKFHFNYCCWSILIINDLGVNRIKSAQKRKIKGKKQMNMQGALYEGYEDMLENMSKHFFFFFLMFNFYSIQVQEKELLLG